MSYDGERLLELLPAVYRIRDSDQGGPLQGLLEIVGDELGVLEASLRSLYDDQFVETCAPWVLPYIGDLLGIVGLPPEPLTARAEVAHTMAYRRRKGTAATLEQLARDVTGLAARADESFELLATTQYLNHLRPENLSFLSVRRALRLEQLGSPFERLPGESTLCHTADVRRIARRRGRYNIPDVAIFLWRLRAFRLSRSPAVPEGGKRRYRFSPLGVDAPLFNRRRTEDVLAHIAGPLDVPGRISRRAFAAAPEDYYGDDRSILIERPGATPADEPTPIPVADVLVCDLSEWPPPPPGTVAIDPELGRLLFPANESTPPLVTFHYGFSASLGGGEYDRVAAGSAATVRVASTRPADFDHVQDAIDALGPDGGVVEILDSGRYAETLTLDASNRQLVLRAAVGSRPTLVLGGELHLLGGPGDAVVLDGLLLAGAPLRVDAGPGGDAALGRLELTHCTLVPGAAPSLAVDSPSTVVEIAASILGGIRADVDARVRIASSIIDATSEADAAYADASGDEGAPLRIEGSTVIGTVKTDLLELASNSIVLGVVTARRRQEGCVRFTYVAPGSETPRRHLCPPADPANAAAVRPILTSSRYGEPGYCQISDRTSCEIGRGADDESELGAFHDLRLPLREAHLRGRLDEYLRFGLEAGVFHAS